MSEPVIRDDFSRSEAVGGIVWLSLAGALSALMEAAYLDASVLGALVPVLCAAWFNSVLTRTARLWNRHPAVALIPFAAWLGCVFLLMFAVPGTGAALVPTSVFTLTLLAAGVAGAVWPLARRK